MQKQKNTLSQEEEKTKIKDKVFRAYDWIIFLLALSCLGLWLYFQKNANAAEYYARHLFPKLVYLPRKLINLIPFSLLEILVYLAIIFLIIIFIWISRFIIRLVKKEKRKSIRREQCIRNCKKILRFFFYLVCILFIVFQMNFGFTYHRKTLGENMQLHRTARGKEDLFSVALQLANTLNYSNTKVERAEDGQVLASEELDETLAKAHEAYHLLTDSSDNDFVQHYLWQGEVRVKGMSQRLSHLWSYTGITGIYVPFLVESTVNTDISEAEILQTSLHEVAHSYGIAREEEANFLAFYAGIHHPDPNYQYAAYLHAFIHTANALYKVDKEMHQQVMRQLDNSIWFDLRARDAYWKQFQGPVKEVSTKINDTYLKVNRQTSGVRSYGEVVDWILSYYLDKEN